MKEEVDRSRRSMLWIAPLGGVALRMPAVLLGQKKQGAEEGEEEVTPTEDLVREHGLLKRILLIYDEVDVRIAQQKEFPPDAVTNSAKIIRSFIHRAVSREAGRRLPLSALPQTQPACGRGQRASTTARSGQTGYRADF